MTFEISAEEKLKYYKNLFLKWIYLASFDSIYDWHAENKSKHIRFDSLTFPYLQTVYTKIQTHKYEIR